MLKITVDDGLPGQTTLEIEKQKDIWLIGDQPFDGDVVKIRANHYHVIWKRRSFSIEVVESDVPGKSFQLMINGHLYRTLVKDDVDILLEGLGMSSSTARKLNHVKAPMPGLIQSVSVEEGSEVSQGDNLLVLVAMKMENVLKSPGSGVVKSLKVTAGQTVEKNQVLLEFE